TLSSTTLACDAVLDYTDSSSLVCPYNMTKYYGAYPLSYLSPQGVEQERPKTSSKTAFQVVMAGLYPSAWIDSWGEERDYKPDSWANVICALLMYGCILGLTGVCLYATASRKDTKGRRRVREYLKRFDSSKTSMTNVTKVFGRDGVKRRNMGDEYIDNEYKGTVVGGYSWCLLYIIGVFMLLWAEYVSIFGGANEIPTLPDDIYADLTADQPPYRRQREVQSMPYSSLPLENGQYLSSAISNRDNLYVVEATSGHTWDTVCIPSDPTFLAMSFADKLRLIFSTSAGSAYIYPWDPKAVYGNPTNGTVLMDSGSLTIETPGCVLAGGQSCSTRFNDTYLATFESTKPLLSYGCYQDADLLYHHISIVSLPWVFGYPSFEDMTFEISMQPSTKFPHFGLFTGTVRTHVIPTAFNQYLLTTPAAVPLIKQETLEIGVVSVNTGWADLAYPSCYFSDAMWEAVETARNETRNLLGDVSLDPFLPVAFDDNGEQTKYSKSALWDSSRVMSYTAAPLPVVVANVSDPEVLFSNSCLDLKGVYFGGQCEALGEGLGFDANPAYDYIQTSPVLVLCGTQDFHVDSHITHVPGWCDKPSTAEGQFGDCASDRMFYATAASSITGEASVCFPNATEVLTNNLSVSIRHTVGSQISQVTFHNLPAMALIGDVVLFYLTLMGFQTGLEGAITFVMRRVKRRRTEKCGVQAARVVARVPTQRGSQPTYAVPQTPNPLATPSMEGAGASKTGDWSSAL
ncbi:hypothetical protein KIPB_006798, partial [Kipferlia bialata]